MFQLICFTKTVQMSFWTGNRKHRKTTLIIRLMSQLHSFFDGDGDGVREWRKFDKSTQVGRPGQPLRWSVQSLQTVKTRHKWNQPIHADCSWNAMYSHYISVSVGISVRSALWRHSIVFWITSHFHLEYFLVVLYCQPQVEMPNTVFTLLSL